MATTFAFRFQYILSLAHLEQQEFLPNVSQWTVVFTFLIWLKRCKYMYACTMLLSRHTTIDWHRKNCIESAHPNKVLFLLEVRIDANINRREKKEEGKNGREWERKNQEKSFFVCLIFKFQTRRIAHAPYGFSLNDFNLLQMSDIII